MPDANFAQTQHNTTLLGLMRYFALLFSLLLNRTCPTPALLPRPMPPTSEVALKRDVNLRVSVRNPLNDYEVRENVVFNPSETREQDEGAREPAHHFALKWEGSKKMSILQVLDDKEAASALKKKKAKGLQPRSMTSEDNGGWVPILAMECRGLEPYAFHPMSEEFVITSEGGTTFEEEVELGEGDWADYDEDNDAPVSMEGIEFKFEAV
eukprot:CAMPEP_0198111742 /NCGR_PEP_ID=MMETSP1442-20131203/3683_1 /TAXON_ID= /ORGANISM="Craspedostauros australis, Strain CCMP3328" /LENGTH=209 /DNA_ID=CAMNT_0043768299 /DNA_START=180 /DNA_END=810 /DNA_ORIENTATION=+